MLHTTIYTILHYLNKKRFSIEWKCENLSVCVSQQLLFNLNYVRMYLLYIQ